MRARKSKAPVGVGLLGTGFIGQVHSRMLEQIANLSEGSVRIASIFSTDQESGQKLASRWPKARRAQSAEELIADPAVDAVYVCTPTRFHREAALAAARSGKHLFLEKPLAMSSAEAGEILNVVESAGIVAQVGLVLRYSPVYNLVRELVAVPDAGRILSATMRDDQDFPTRGMHSGTWRANPALTAGGALAEHSIHDVDLLSWIFGPIAAVDCRLRSVQGIAGIEDFGTIRLEFASGVYGTLTSVWHRMAGRSSNRRLEIFAENVYISCDDTDSLGPLLVQRAGEESESTISREQVAQRFQAILLREFPHLAPLERIAGVPYAVADANFVAAVRGAVKPYPPLQAGVRAQAVVEAAYRSARERRTVAIEHL